MNSRVLFRIDRARASDRCAEPYSVLLDAPELPELVTVYAHIGQHGAGDLSVLLATSRAATVWAYAPLLEELEQIGYCLRVIEEEDLSDTQRIDAALERARGTLVPPEIARMIAAQWHSGQASALYAYASSGKMPADRLALTSEVLTCYMDAAPDERRALRALLRVIRRST